MLKARFILPAIISLLLVGGAAMAQSSDVANGGSNGGLTGGSAQVGNQLLINLPTVVALHIIGSTNGDDITFSPTETQIYNAVAAPTSIGPAANGFQEIDGYTNSSGGADFVVNASVNSSSTTGSDAASVLAAVTIKTKAFNGYTDHIARGKDTAIFKSANVALALDGTLQPGDYVYDVTYTLTAK